MTRGTCHFCGKSVENHHTAVRRASGWFVDRDKGLHALIDKKVEPNLIAHKTCLDESLHKSQANLFGQAA